MTNLLLGFTLAGLLAAGSAGPDDRQIQASIEQIRLVCDQYCTCWRTRNQEHGSILADREDLACPQPRHNRLYYNGHYRKGPATGLGFESRFPVREFPFPF